MSTKHAEVKTKILQPTYSYQLFSRNTT